MRILYLSNGYPPLHAAGAENYTAGIAAAFARAGHQVKVVCAGEWDTGPAPISGVASADHEGVSVLRLNLNWTRGPDPNRYLFDNPLTGEYVGKILDDYRPDVVHNTSCYTLSGSVIREVKRRGCPLVITMTDFWFLCPQVTLLRSNGSLCDGQTTPWDCLKCMLWKARAYRWPAAVLPEPMVDKGLTWISRQPRLSRMRGFRGMALDMAARKEILPELLALADVLIAPSKFLADMYFANGIDRDIRVIDYGHDLRWIPDVVPKDNTAHFVFGYVGRITEAKGAHVLIEAAARLNGNLPVEVQIFGDLHQDRRFAERLKDMASHAAGVTFCGRFRRDQLAEVFSQIDVLVVPSLWYENHPLVVQEAFAANRPVVASNLGGMAGCVEHEVNGLLFEPGNPQALAETLVRFLNEPGLLGQLKAGIQAVKTTQEEVETLTTIYNECIAGASRPHERT